MARNKGTALTEQDGLQAIQGIRRLQEIEKTSILTPNLEAEKGGIQNFLQNILLTHADELLACWSAVRFEYEPFVGSVSLVMDRVSSIRRSRLLAAQVARDGSAPPENETAPLTQDDGKPTPAATDSVVNQKSNIIHISR
jgi:hypothetical protein